jgi:hypothetical protein
LANQLFITDWSLSTDCADAEEAFNNFSSIYNHHHNIFFKPRTARFNKNVNKIETWMTSGLLNSRATKLKLAKLCFTNPSQQANEKYNFYCTLYNKLVRLSKKNYFASELARNVNNLKNTWNIIYKALNRNKSKGQISSLIVDNVCITNPLDVANNFNKFFTSIAMDISSSINPADCTFDEDNVEQNFSMCDQPVSYDELISAVSKLQDKKSLDFNNNSMFLVKKILPVISTPLLHVFNRSLATGTVPSKLKIAKVIPIYKAGDPNDPNNYRPISLLCTFSKILEKIVFSRLMSYLETNNIISQHQFGFRPKHSTFHPMLQIVNKAAEALNKKKFMLVIFCDLKKAFDTVDINILLKKLKKIGVNGNELRWGHSYLSNRSQFVYVNECISDLLNISVGVPQGSILGPLLFLIYIKKDQFRISKNLQLFS